VSTMLLCCFSSTTIVIFFFFQAEDGIRDRNVTGVQTCALPISIITCNERDKKGIKISSSLIFVFSLIKRNICEELEAKFNNPQVIKKMTKTRNNLNVGSSIPL